MIGNWSWGAVITWHIEAGEDFWWEGMYSWVAHLWLWHDDLMDMDDGWWKYVKTASGWKHNICSDPWMVHRWRGHNSPLTHVCNAYTSTQLPTPI